MRQRLWNRTLNLGWTRSLFQRSSADFFAKLFLPLTEWHTEPRQQAARLVVGAGCGDDRHFQPAQLVDLVVVDLREDDLLAQAQRVVAASVEPVGRHAAEVADAGQRDVQQLVQEVPHAATAKRRLDADRLAGAQLERGDRFPGLDKLRLLAGDRRDVADGGVERLVVVLRLADADVDDDLVDARDLHHVAVVELLGHLRHDGFAVGGQHARWRFRRLTPLTTILCWSGRVRSTSPCLPLSLPATIITGSPGASSSQRRFGSGLFLSMSCYRTSGASEMIFMKLRSRSSRATGPKMRVPRGLLAVARRTAAFSSKRISEPSGRLYSFFTRTTTALTTSPFLTWPPGWADLTVAVMMSPTDAYLR